VVVPVGVINPKFKHDPAQAAVVDAHATQAGGEAEFK